jgi:hypothetical protein
LDQRLVCQTLSGNASHEAIEPSQCMVLNTAFIQPEGKFINVAAKMFLACVMIDANQSALENRKNTLNPISSG